MSPLNLPELVFLITSFLPRHPIHLIRCQKLNRLWKSVIDNHTLWKQKYKLVTGVDSNLPEVSKCRKDLLWNFIDFGVCQKCLLSVREPCTNFFILEETWQSTYPLENYNMLCEDCMILLQNKECFEFIDENRHCGLSFDMLYDTTFRVVTAKDVPKSQRELRKKLRLQLEAVKSSCHV